MVQVSAVMLAAAVAVIVAPVQTCPPKARLKIALPVVLGVPEMLYTSVPFPLARLPDCNVSVSPVTTPPLEAIGLPAG